MRSFRPFSKIAFSIGYIVAASVLWLGLGTAQAQTFVNGGFETDNWPAGSNAGVSPTGWTTVHSGNGNWPYGVHNDSDPTEEHTPFGNQFIELCARDCDGNLPRGSISQTVSGFVIGEQYRLDFRQAPEHHPGETEESYVNVSIAGGTPASTDFSGAGYGGYFTQWKPQSLIFTADATTLTFTFSGVSNASNNTESGLDEISVSPLSSAPPGPGAGSTPIPTIPVYGLVLLMVCLLIVAIRRLRASASGR